MIRFRYAWRKRTKSRIAIPPIFMTEITAKMILTRKMDGHLFRNNKDLDMVINDILHLHLLLNTTHHLHISILTMVPIMLPMITIEVHHHSHLPRRLPPLLLLLMDHRREWHPYMVHIPLRIILILVISISSSSSNITHRIKKMNRIT